MTQEQYDRASEVFLLLNNLDNAKSTLKRSDFKLAYVLKETGTQKANSITELGNSVMYSIMSHRSLSNILDRHDKQIREEIDAEIEKLKKEIEEL